MNYLKKIARRVLRTLKSLNIAEIMWFFDQHFRLWRMKLVPAARVQILKQELMGNKDTSRSGCLITITLASRQFGHRDNNLEGYFKSFLAMTEKPERVEMLIKIDNDDDLIFFSQMKQKYNSRINLVFVVGDRGRGYSDWHKYNASLLSLRNPTSLVWVLQSEDAVFTLPQWDSRLLDAVAAYPHEYFIGTDCQFEEAISIKGPNPVTPVPVYWVRGDLFPVMGFGIIKCTEEIAQRHSGWTSLGNGFNIDGFAGDILRRLWQRHRLKLHMQFPQFVKEKPVRGWSGNKDRQDLRSKTLLKFFEAQEQAVRDEMVDNIAKKIKEI